MTGERDVAEFEQDPIGRLAGSDVVAFGHILEGHQRLVAVVEAELKAETDMTVSEMEVLIRLANEQENCLRPSDLAAMCVMSTSGCTRLIDRLERQQLVRRRPHGTDRRGLMVELTKRGRRLLESALPMHYRSLDRHLWSVLSKRELEQLSQIMRKIRDANS